MSSDLGESAGNQFETIPAAETTPTEYRYRCSHCEAEYQNELVARAHITRLDDKNHKPHNGFMPEAEVEVVEPSGSVVGSVSRHPSEMDPTNVGLHDVPAGLSEVNKHITATAAQNPEERKKTTITDLVEERLADKPLDTPPYRTVAAVLNRVFRPHREETTKGDDLASLTTKQQAVLIARLAAPEESKAALAKLTGTSSNYPAYVLDRADDILAELEERLSESGDDTESVVTDELSPDALRDLFEGGYLQKVPIDLDQTALQEPVASDNPQPSPESSQGAPDATESSDKRERSEDLSQWGSPVENPSGLSATPDSSFGTAGGDDDSLRSTQAADEDAKPDDATDTPVEPPTDNEEQPAPEQGTIPTSEIETLKCQTAFTRSVLQGAESAPETELAVSLASKIEQSLDELLVSKHSAD